MPPRKAKKKASEELKLHAYVLLGMLRLGARSGYDIKRFVELSGRHFWTISYPQIYPELHRLEKLGLVKGKRDSASGRGRKLFSITAAGRRELDRWLRSREDGALEVRDAGLLKVMFSDSPELARVQLEAMRQRSEEAILVLKALSRPVADAIREEGNPYPLLTIDFGIEFHRALVRTCRKMERSI